jgi:hypothetical protein
MRLALNHPVETTTSTLVVDAGLPVGAHRIRLVVVDDRGQRSKPTEIVIRVVTPASPLSTPDPHP